MTDNLKVLSGMTVVDTGVGMAAALAAKYLHECGARVLRVEPAGGDPFAAVYPAYAVWRRGAVPAPAGELDALLATADICIAGGEDHPAVARRKDLARLVERHPRLVLLDITAYPAGTADAARPGTDLLVQARSGLAYEQYSQRAMAMSFEPCSVAAALQGLIGLLAALYEREGSGRGQLVHTSLHEAMLIWMGMFWVEVEKPTPLSKFIMPLDPHPTIFRCADGRYIHFVTGSAGSKYLMYQALGIDDPDVKPGDSGLPKADDPPKNFFGPVDLYAEYCAKQPAAVLLERMWERGLPANLVQRPGECWDDPQIVRNGIVATDADGTRHVGSPLKIAGSGTVRKAPVKAGPKPLSGVRILDFGAFVAGPLCSTILADLGADVIKVELLGGDPSRKAVFRAFSAANRGKRSIALDLKNADALKITRELLASADAVTSNFRPGAAARLGIDPDSLHKVRPDMVVLESPAYGNDGPLAERAGFDMIMQAFTGLEYAGGGTGNTPLWNRLAPVDTTAAMLGSIAVLCGLVHRARTGEGTTMESPLVNAGVWLLSDLVQKPDGTFVGGEPVNASRTGHRASEAMYEAGDGWIALAARGAAAGRSLATALGLGELPSDPLAWGDAEAERIAAAIAGRTQAEAIAALESAGIWVEACRPAMGEATLHDATWQRLGLVRSSTHPQFGRILEPGVCVRFSRSAGGSERAVDLLGAATRDILAELGHGADEIDDLVARKVVGAAD